MLANRIAAGTIGTLSAVTIATTTRPLDLGPIEGPWTIALGSATIAASIWCLITPGNPKASAAMAASFATWFTLRGIDLVGQFAPGPDGRPRRLWTGLASSWALVTLAILFSVRSLRRLGFEDAMWRETHPGEERPPRAPGRR